MKKPLSKNIETLLWDIDASKNLESPVILFERILNFGDITEVSWLLENFDRDEIINFIETKGKRRLNKKSFVFWSNYFELKDILANTSTSSEVTFGKDRWL